MVKVVAKTSEAPAKSAAQRAKEREELRMNEVVPGKFRVRDGFSVVTGIRDQGPYLGGMVLEGLTRRQLAWHGHKLEQLSGEPATQLGPKARALSAPPQTTMQREPKAAVVAAPEVEE